MDTMKIFKDNVRTSLRNDLEKYEALKGAWEAVTYPTKKDGKPFAVLSKNIQGAVLTTKEYGIKGLDNSLRVSARTVNRNYVSDEIYCYDTVDRYRSCLKAEAKPQNVHERGLGLLPAYVYDIEDIKEAVRDEIMRLQKYIEAIRKQLAAVDSVVDEFYPRFESLRKDLKEAAGYSEYYLMYSMIREAYEFKL